MTDTLDLSGRLLPPVTYYPFPALVPHRLLMNATAPMALADLRRLGACAEDGPDTVYAPVERTAELSHDAEADTQPIVVGGLNVQRMVLEVGQGQNSQPVKVVSWWATVSGLTFHADDCGKVYADGPDGRVVLHDPAADQWKQQPFQPTVYAAEKAGPGLPHGPDFVPNGKSKRYPTYAALVEARNAARRKGTHGRIPDAVKSLLSMTPMIDKRRSITAIGVEPRIEPDGLTTRRVGERYTLRLDEATAQRLHGEKAGSRQAVLRYDTVDTVEATDANVGHAAMQLLREFDTETMVTVIGLLMKAYDTGNNSQRIGAADLAAIRDRELTSAKDRKAFNAMSDLLSQVVIEVVPMKGDGTKARLNLFARQGEVIAPGGKSLPLVTLNETLYRAMLATGHGVLMDRRILTADLRTHQWEVRIYAALSIQWSVGWVVNGYAKGKHLRRTAKVLLADSLPAYDIAEEVRKRGAGVVRQKLAGTFDSMVRLGWLKAWTLAKEATDPADDTYDFTPPETLAKALTGHRTALADNRKQGKATKDKR